MTAKDPKIAVDARLVFGSGSDDNGPYRYAELQIDDRASSLRILEMRLNPDQLMAFLGSSTARGEADWTQHPERVGRKMEHGSISIPQTATEEQIAARIESFRHTEGWETIERRKDNKQMWVIVGRRWVAPEQEK
jgi:hypothetical protein